MAEELRDRVRQHDVQALSEFLHENRFRLMAFIEQQLGPALRRKVEPDDIFQEVSAEAVRSLAKIEFGDRDPLSWLFQLIERKIIDAHRHFFQTHKRDAGKEVAIDRGNDDSQHQGLIQLLVASMTSASQAYSRNVKEIRISEAMKQLQPEQQEAIRLRYVESLPSKEIAERLGKSDASVRVMLTRSLKKLQELLAVGESNTSN